MNCPGSTSTSKIPIALLSKIPLAPFPMATKARKFAQAPLAYQALSRPAGAKSTTKCHDYLW